MRIVFANDDERDYLAAEALAMALGHGEALDSLLPGDGLGPANTALLLAAGLLPSVDDLVAALTAQPPEAPGGPYRWLLAAHCAAQGHCRDADLPGQLAESLVKHVKDPWDIWAEDSWVKEALMALGEPAPFLAALGDSLEWVRAGAAEALGQLGHATPEVTQALMAALSHPGWGVSRAAAVALGQLGRATPAVTQALVATLRDSNTVADVRARVVEALGHLGQDTPAVTQMLMGALHDPDEGVRGQAAESLGQLGYTTPEVWQALVDALGDPYKWNRIVALRALGQLGFVTPDVALALTQTLVTDLRNRDERGRSAATTGTLGQRRQTTAEVTQALTQTFVGALRDQNRVSEVRAKAVERPGQLNAASPTEIAALVDTLRDPRAQGRPEAARTLGQLSQTTPEARGALIDVLRDPDAWVRAYAAGAVVQLGLATPQLTQMLTREHVATLSDSDLPADVRAAAIWTLAQLGHAPPEVAQTLVGALSDWNRWISADAARALGLLARRDEIALQWLWAELNRQHDRATIDGLRRAIRIGEGKEDP